MSKSTSTKTERATIKTAVNPGDLSLNELREDERFAAFQRVRAEAEALPAAMLKRYSLDCGYAFTAVTFAVPRLAPLDHDIRSMPHFDVRNYVHYADYANATVFAHTQVLIHAEDEDGSLAAIAQEGGTLRTVLLASLQALAARGHISASTLSGIGAVTGYRALMNDLLAIVAILRKVWPKHGARMLVEPHEVDRASEIAQKIARMDGDRDATDDDMGALLLRRQRCATLLMRSNRQLRRVVGYLREDDDIDQIVPSIFLPNTPKRGARKVVTPTPQPPEPALPVNDATVVIRPANAS